MLISNLFKTKINGYKKVLILPQVEISLLNIYICLLVVTLLFNFDSESVVKQTLLVLVQTIPFKHKNDYQWVEYNGCEF